jgi:alpha-L-fucosidase
LITLYDQAIGRGGQLMLGLAPDSRGLLPENDAKRLEEFGAAIAKRYGTTANLLQQHVKQDPDVERALDNDPDTFWSAPQASHHSTLEINFAKAITFDHALIMERLANGQQVQSFRVEVWDGSAWKSVVADHSIGHKRIESFAPQTASRVRLNILSSTDTAEISEFQLFSIGDR